MLGTLSYIINDCIIMTYNDIIMTHTCNYIHVYTLHVRVEVYSVHVSSVCIHVHCTCTVYGKIFVVKIFGVLNFRCV